MGMDNTLVDLIDARESLMQTADQEFAGSAAGNSCGPAWFESQAAPQAVQRLSIRRQAVCLLAAVELNAMLQLGQSRPWPEALATFSGEHDVDASAINDYFAPLSTWLDKQNKGNACGR